MQQVFLSDDEMTDGFWPAWCPECGWAGSSEQSTCGKPAASSKAFPAPEIKSTGWHIPTRTHAQWIQFLWNERKRERDIDPDDDDDNTDEARREAIRDLLQSITEIEEAEAYQHRVEEYYSRWAS